MHPSPAEPSQTIRPIRDAGATLLTLGGLIAAFGAASCCGLPLVLATMGVGSAWLGGVAILAAPHQSALLFAAAVCLTAGAILLWRRSPAAACETGVLCSKPAFRNMTLAGLIAGIGLLTIGYFYA